VQRVAREVADEALVARGLGEQGRDEGVDALARNERVRAQADELARGNGRVPRQRAPQIPYVPNDERRHDLVNAR
jgi:hypothetical protein